MSIENIWEDVEDVDKFIALGTCDTLQEMELEEISTKLAVLANLKSGATIDGLYRQYIDEFKQAK